MLLAASMMLPLVGCSAYNSEKAKVKKALISMDFEEEDEDYLLDVIEEDEDEIDPFFAESSDKKAFKNFLDDEYEDVSHKDIKNIFTGVNKIDNDGNTNEFAVYVVEFNDKDICADYYDETIDQFDEMLDDFDDQFGYLEDQTDTYVVDSEEGDNRYSIFIHVEYEGEEVFLIADIWVKNNVAVCIVGDVIGEKSSKPCKEIKGNIEDFYASLKMDSPQDLIE